MRNGRRGTTYPRRSLHGQVAHEIGLRIMRGELPPGAILPNESDLSAELQVSRTALREAFKVLAAKGLVEARPRTGTRIRPRHAWNLLDPDVLAWQFAVAPMQRFYRDLFQIREIIEPAAAAIAAAAQRREDIAEIERAYRAMEASADGPDREAWTDSDLRFHQGILTATGNELFGPLGSLIEAALASSFKLSTERPGAARDSLPRHRRVLDAIERGVAAAARAAMHRLLDASAQDIRDITAAAAPDEVPPRPARGPRERKRTLA
ncbi:MAG: FadR/GntR family transcriptional regulator [Dongiaceae bacterium]